MKNNNVFIKNLFDTKKLMGQEFYKGGMYVNATILLINQLEDPQDKNFNHLMVDYENNEKLIAKFAVNILENSFYPLVSNNMYEMCYVVTFNQSFVVPLLDYMFEERIHNINYKELYANMESNSINKFILDFFKRDRCREFWYERSDKIRFNELLSYALNQIKVLYDFCSCKPAVYSEQEDYIVSLLEEITIAAGYYFYYVENSFTFIENFTNKINEYGLRYPYEKYKNNLLNPQYDSNFLIKKLYNGSKVLP